MLATLSIITPTFNGRDRLVALRDMLAAQTVRPNEWIIVLDGFDERTWKVCESLAIPDVTIVVDVIEHNHKKAAMNRGVTLATSEMVAIADDDDPLPPDSLEILLTAWQSLETKERSRFVGVTGLCVDEAGETVGDRFPSDHYESNAIQSFFDDKVTGEKWGILRLDVLRQYPFFEEPEGYVGEGTVWMEIARTHQTLYINRPVRIYVARENSIMTSRHTRDHVNNNCDAYAYGYLYMSEAFLQRLVQNPRYIIGCCSFYFRYLLHCWTVNKLKPYHFHLRSVRWYLLVLIGAPMGVVFYFRDLAGWARQP